MNNFTLTISSDGIIYYIKNLCDLSVIDIISSYKYSDDCNIKNVMDSILTNDTNFKKAKEYSTQAEIAKKNFSVFNENKFDLNRFFNKDQKQTYENQPDLKSNTNTKKINEEKRKELDHILKNLEDFKNNFSNIENIFCECCGTSLFDFMTQNKQGCLFCWIEFYYEIREYLNVIGQVYDDTANNGNGLKITSEDLPFISEEELTKYTNENVNFFNKCKKETEKELSLKIKTHLKSFQEENIDFLNKELEYWVDEKNKNINSNNFEIIQIIEDKIKIINEKISRNTKS